MTQYLKGCDAVVHAATAVPPRWEEPKDWEVNNRLRMEGTSKLIEAAWRAGVSFYLQLSETRAYVNGRDGWLGESTAFDIVPKKAVFTLAVADMERRVREVSKHGMDWAILRVGSLIGPGTSQDDLTHRLRREEEIVPGDGAHFISPVHVTDAAEAFVKASQKHPREKILNIVDEPVHYGDYVDLLADRLRVGRPIRDLTSSSPSSHRCSNDMARRELDWVPQFGFYKPRHAPAVGGPKV